MSRWIRERPVALVLAVLTAAAAVLAGVLPGGPSPEARAAAALDVEGLGRGRVWTLLTSVLVPNGPAELLLVLGALVLVVGTAEGVLGHARTALAWLGTTVVGGLAGIALQAAGLLARGLWTTPPATTLVLHPETPVLGVLLTASAFTGPLWRRRIRLVGFSGLVVLLLYSGQPEDLDHLAGAVAGLALGVLLTRSRPRLRFPRSSHHEARGLLAAVIAIAAVGPVVAVLQPTGYGLLRPLGRLFRDPLPFADAVRQRCAAAATTADCQHVEQLARLNGPGVVLLAVLPLLILLVAAVAVQRGRRAGTWLAAGVGVLLAVFGVVSAVTGAAVGGDRNAASLTIQSLLAVLVPALVAAAALRGRRHCPVLPGRATTRAAVLIAAAGIVATGVAYPAVGLLTRGQFTPRTDLPGLLRELPARYVPAGFLHVDRIAVVPTGPIAALLHGWTGPAAWTVLLGAALALVLSVRRTTTGREQLRLRELLQQGSTGSIAWMTTWPGNRVWFSADGRHAVAYREGAGVALTVGEPVGCPDGAVDAARAFAVDCDDRGLVPAFYAVRPEFAAALGDGGAAWSVVEVGEDTVVDPARFTMRGRHWQDVRSAVNRADRAGVRAVWTTWSTLTIAQRAQVQAIDEEWIADRRLPELGFTLGALAELADREVRLMLAIGPGDRIHAVTSWLPTWREGEVDGLTLDWMRRRGDAANGTVEFLIAAVIGAAQQRGLRFVSLSVAPLAGAEDGEDRLQRALAAVARLLEPVYGFRSLAAFKDKFRPERRPQVLAVPDLVALPAVGVAVARAYLPDRVLPALVVPRRP